MTPKEKADELVDKYDSALIDGNIYFAVRKYASYKCALIAVDELLKYSKAHGFIGLTEEYEQIKQEIEKL